MTVETILRQKGADVVTIEPEASIRRAADWLRVKNIGALVVTSGKAVLGLISEREIVHAFSHYGETAASMPVKEIMRYGVITVSPDESVSRVMQLMTRHRVRHMPVLRDGGIFGRHTRPRSDDQPHLQRRSRQDGVPDQHERDVLTNRRAWPLLGELFSARCSQHAPTSPAMLACEKTILRELYWERAKELLAENDRLEIRPRVGLMPLGVPWPAGPSLSGLQI